MDLKGYVEELTGASVDFVTADMPDYTSMTASDALRVSEARARTPFSDHELAVIRHNALTVPDGWTSHTIRRLLATLDAELREAVKLREEG